MLTGFVATARKNRRMRFGGFPEMLNPFGSQHPGWLTRPRQLDAAERQFDQPAVMRTIVTLGKDLLANKVEIAFPACLQGSEIAPAECIVIAIEPAKHRNSDSVRLQRSRGELRQRGCVRQTRRGERRGVLLDV